MISKVLDPPHRGPNQAFKVPRRCRRPFQLCCVKRLKPTQRGAGFFTEPLVAEPLQSGYAIEFLVARKGLTKGGFGGAGARYILTNFDLLDTGACSREQGRTSSQLERPSGVNGQSAIWFSISTARAQHDQKGLADDEEVLPQRPILNV